MFSSKLSFLFQVKIWLACILSFVIFSSSSSAAVFANSLRVQCLARANGRLYTPNDEQVLMRVFPEFKRTVRGRTTVIPADLPPVLPRIRLVEASGRRDVQMTSAQTCSKEGCEIRNVGITKQTNYRVYFANAAGYLLYSNYSVDACSIRMRGSEIKLKALDGGDLEEEVSVNVGQPIPNFGFRIVDENGNPALNGGEPINLEARMPDPTKTDVPNCGSPIPPPAITNPGAYTQRDGRISFPGLTFVVPNDSSHLSAPEFYLYARPLNLCLPTRFKLPDWQ